MDLSLCLIVKNEELKLSDCLQSFQGVFQKLIIVDTGSIDKTQDIAQQFGAKVYKFAWNKDFAAARNFALSKVTTKLVMVVDADDRIEPKIKEQLIQYLEKLPPATEGIFMPYLYSAIQNGQGSMAYLPRIWNNHLGFQYFLPIHEYLNIPRENLKNFQRINLPIIHNKKDKDFYQSFARNLDILNNVVRKRPLEPRILYYLGHDNQYAKNYQKGIYWYSRYIHCHKKNRDELYKAYVGKGLCHLQLKQLKNAQKAFKNALKTNPAFIEPYLYLGDLEMEEKKYAKAVQLYFQAMQCSPPKTHVFINTRLYNGIAKQKMTAALKALEKK